MVLHLAALFIYRPQCLQSFLLTTFAPFLGLHHSSSIQHNVGIMRSVWLALLKGWQRNNVTTFYIIIKSATQTKPLSALTRRIIYAMLNAACATRLQQAARPKALPCARCTCIANLRGKTFAFYKVPLPRRQKK